MTFTVQKWKFSWSLVAVVASLVALVSIVHLFLFPLAPSSFGYLGRQIQSFSLPKNGSQQPEVNLHQQYPADLHKAVVYQGAPWKEEIGRWLSGCDSITRKTAIVERIGGKTCKSDCNGQGICNRELGQCRCFHGYAGEGCSERLQLECNHPGSQEQPYGPWVVSICSAYCDTTRAMCFCGEGTKYPNRPVAEACGFQSILPSEPNGPKLTDWAKADLENIFTTNSSKPGWCNVDPEEAYASKVKSKDECDCKYDCHFGRFCEIPVECVCLNQCSHHGYCRGGFCQCDSGWYGTDCSIPSALSSVQEWPQWLRPATLHVPDNAHLTIDNIDAVVEKKRPLIYVYDLPPEFNSHLLEGRHFRFECVNRIYTDQNATFWTDQLYGSQMALYESILASPYRTLNGEEADYFFVPVLDSCIITRADDAPHLSLRSHLGLRSSLTLEFYKKAYDHITEKYPFWNRSSGKDHIWHDVSSLGNTNSKHNHSTTAYWADNWDGIPSTRRGNHPCFDPEKDLVLPAWKQPDPGSLRLKLWSRPRKERTKFFYFNGNLGPAYEHGRPEATYSMGIRQKLAKEFGSSPDKEGKLGNQHAEDVIVTPLRSDNYYEDLANSLFCGVLPGDGWSGRMEDSVLHGCIPVIIQDGIFLPYENVLNYESFAVRIREDDIPNLISTLRGFNETEIEFMLANVRMIWQRFLYRDSVLLEAERQKSRYGHVDDWVVEFISLNEDDVFSTFIQVLHYKLHNDPWRRKLGYLQKDFGLPKECVQSTN
ncbi:hypothetical protein AQUCO_00900245v1 [Aquilegia coerulea]|uniref:EGF-like domain-containing protein n=1 Tax=Aquilegia coerulea TaxID=218851 RepID=A0A2G5ECU4_AQUCA|nr:hypothetical protein AQUCO_00900245v1 [Aquilegia coerulea]